MDEKKHLRSSIGERRSETKSYGPLGERQFERGSDEAGQGRSEDNQSR